MARALSFLIRYFSNYYTLHRSDLAARAAPLDPRLQMYEDSVVLLAWFLFLKVELCSLILALSSGSVKPMYVCFGVPGVTTSHW